MNERSVCIAVWIQDRVAQQLTCSMFANAGAKVLLCEDPAAILQAADRIQAIVLGLTGAAEATIDAVVMLHKRLATIPIYAIADTAGERHAKRLKTFGVSQVIPHGELQQRAGQLARQLAESSRIENWHPRPAGWAADKTNQGYDIESMDLGAWLSIPDNRRLLGETGPFEQAAGAGAKPPSGATRQDADGTVEVQAAPAPRMAGGVSKHGAGGAPPGPDLQRVPEAGGLGATCGLADCPALGRCREEHRAQNGSILEAHKQREKRLQADIRSELLDAIARRIAASEAKTQERMNESVAALRREMVAAIRRASLLLGGLIGIASLLAVVWPLAM